MSVRKRDGMSQDMSFDKILRRVKKLGAEVSPPLAINYSQLVIKVIDQLYDNISTTNIDELTAEQCASLSTSNYDYGILANRIIVSNHHKNTPAAFTDAMQRLYQRQDVQGQPAPLLHESFWQLVQRHGPVLDAMIDCQRDYLFDYFGFKTLERAYLMKLNGEIVERPQHMWLRVALGIHGEALDAVKETYDLLSLKYFTHATPTLFNAGTLRPQLSSCYLLGMESDSIDGIYNTLKDCASISKWAGGIGLHVHNVRATGAHIGGTNGTSNGLVPMLRVFNMTARYVDQCFPPETLVQTLDGSKPIAEVTIMDRVLTSDGTYQAVQKPVRHQYAGPLLHITLKGHDNKVRVTPAHQIFSIRAASLSAASLSAASLSAASVSAMPLDPIFQSAETLRVGDLVAVPLPTYEADLPHLTLDDCFFYGTLLSSKCTWDTDKQCIRVNFTTSLNQSMALNFVLEYLQKRGIVVLVNDPYNELNNLHLEWSVAQPGWIWPTDFFVDLKKKIPSPLLHLPKAKIFEILKGFQEGQTMQNETMQNETRQNETRQSEAFAADLAYLFLRLGIFYGGFVPRMTQTHMFVPISAIDFEAHYEGVVHDFEIDAPHDYTISQLGIVHNGGGKRNGSFAIYLEPWHADIEAFLELKKNHGDEELRARDLFYALWLPDLFMQKVKADEDWALFCPHQCPGLADCYGEAFQHLYDSYVAAGKAAKMVKARALWYKILDSQMETGTPYLLYKDAANKKSNQQNLGVIKSSNLCCEIIEYSDGQETAVCNLASIALNKFVLPDRTFDYAELHRVTQVVTRNLNKIIDVNFYPTPKTQKSNWLHRPIGIGVQGLADTFALMDLAFHSAEARVVNKQIFETMYHAALSSSCTLAQKDGPYSSFQGSPAAQGQLQFDLWQVDPGTERYDWPALKAAIKQHGLRNSLLLAPMPTASTSQILGNNECFEPFTSNLYARRTNAGEFVVVNKYLMEELREAGLWTTALKNEIIFHKGSVQQLTCLTPHQKEKYKTVWEIPMKHLIDLSADRGAFICQSQSLNLWVEDPDYKSLTALHFYSWQAGLKTGLYYLRRKAKHQAQQFTLQPITEGAECENCSA